MRQSVLALCAMLGFGCAPGPDVTTIATAAPRGAVPAPGGWYPGETMVPERQNAGVIPSLNQATPSHRKGVTPTGRAYNIWPDGSGGVDDDASAGWEVNCAKDAITDRRDCVVKPGLKSELNLVVLYSGALIAGVCISEHNFPGRTGAIRIDGGAPITTDQKGCADSSVARRLAKGKAAVVRFVKWPHEYNRDVSGSLEGLKEALELAEFIRANIDKLKFGEGV